MTINVAKLTKETVENLTKDRDMHRNKYNELIDEYIKSQQKVVEIEIELAFWKQQVGMLRSQGPASSSHTAHIPPMTQPQSPPPKQSLSIVPYNMV